MRTNLTSARRPWESEKPVDWEDAIPEEYMSAEMVEAP